MPSEKEPFYDPVPPTYDQALASGSRRDAALGLSRSSLDAQDAGEAESLSLLQHSTAAASSSRRPGGYRPPTAETDDEDSLWDSDSDLEDGEADQVRREMQEMDVEEPRNAGPSLWGKRIGLLSLQNWRWKWSWRPRLPRLRIQLPQRPADADHDDDNSGADGGATAQNRQWVMPRINPLMAAMNFARVVAVSVLLWLLYMLFAGNFLDNLSDRLNGGLRFNPEELRDFLQSNVDPARMRDTVQHFTTYAHVAGTEGDYATALDVETMFSKAGLEDVRMDQYSVYINYPTKDGRAVQIMDKDGEKAIWTAKLEEEDDGSESAGRQTYAFHGHSKSGDVKGPLIYANYGSREEFQKLKDMGIKTEGAIALVRYYGTQTDRALKVKAAELAGFAGCIIYSDPADDGFLRGDVAPDGSCMPSDGVQRGAVSLMSWMVGDVLTPGWESKDNLPRMKVNQTAGLVGIPSLPLAWRDAQILLQHLKGHGKKVPEDWQGGVPDVGQWWTGDASSPIVRLKNEQEENERQPIWNVYGRIIGMEQRANSIILGNHRDAWAFGATDPHTGTAILIELARIFGELKERGWRPLRTIEFMSWDAEEYNLIGSTEYVEANLDWLRENAFAYINLDTAVWGTQFTAAGSPVFEKSVLNALDRVGDPHFNKSLRELWTDSGSELKGLGAGSDYVAFQDIAGTSSLDMFFGGGIHPYHSSYDTFHLMDHVIDPGFVYHSLLAQVTGLVMLELADRAIFPFDMSAYANRLQQWVFDLEKWALDNGSPADGSVNFKEMKEAAELAKEKAKEFEGWEMRWDQTVMASGGWETQEVTELRLLYNSKMSEFETALLDLEMGGGIPNRTQFKHVVFGPQLWSGYDEAFFPAIRDCVDAREWKLAAQIMAKTAALIRQAAKVLEM